MSDKSLQLGDQAGIIKAFYALDSRMKVSAAVQGTAKLPGTGGTAGDEIDPSSESFVELATKEQSELSSILAAEPLVQFRFHLH